MPGMTPNFSIRYPCAGEIIDPTAFQNFANDVDAALVTVNTAAAAAVARPRAAQRSTLAGTSCAAGATTAMAFTTVDYSSGITLTGSGFTPTTTGVYMIDAEFSGFTVVTTVTSWSGQIQQNAVTKYRRKMGFSIVPNAAGYLNISGALSCTAGDTIAVQWLWTGTGGPMFVYCRATISLIALP